MHLLCVWICRYQFPLRYTLDLRMVLFDILETLFRQLGWFIPLMTSWSVQEDFVLVLQSIMLQNIMLWLFLIEASSLGISHMVVRLDSQLVVSQLNRVYVVRNPALLRLYLRICLLERSFDYIHYEHIPRELNLVTDSLANYILNWHLAHIWIFHKIEKWPFLLKILTLN